MRWLPETLPRSVTGNDTGKAASRDPTGGSPSQGRYQATGEGTQCRTDPKGNSGKVGSRGRPPATQPGTSPSPHWALLEVALPVVKKPEDQRLWTPGPSFEALRIADMCAPRMSKPLVPLRPSFGRRSFLEEVTEDLCRRPPIVSLTDGFFRKGLPCLLPHAPNPGTGSRLRASRFERLQLTASQVQRWEAHAATRPSPSVTWMKRWPI